MILKLLSQRLIYSIKFVSLDSLLYTCLFHFNMLQVLGLLISRGVFQVFSAFCSPTLHDKGIDLSDFYGHTRVTWPAPVTLQNRGWVGVVMVAYFELNGWMAGGGKRKMVLWWRRCYCRRPPPWGRRLFNTVRYSSK